jgi:hypothetical protein
MKPRESRLVEVGVECRGHNLYLDSTWPQITPGRVQHDGRAGHRALAAPMLGGVSRAELRFGIGDPDGRRSLVWKLWATRDDIYAAPRDAGKYIKATLHGDRDFWHIARPRETQVAAGLDPDGRFAARRPGPTPEGPASFQRGLSLIFPDSDLAKVGRIHPQTVWVPSPGEGRTAHVVVFLADAGLPIGPLDRGHVLGQLETPLSNRRVVAVAYDMEDHGDERTLWADVRADPEGAALWSITTEAGKRIIICGEMQQPERAWLYMAELFLPSNGSGGGAAPRAGRRPSAGETQPPTPSNATTVGP